MRIQKRSCTVEQPDGIATGCETVSVCTLPPPLSQALRAPPRAGYCDHVPITFAVAVHGDVPFSKPPLPTGCEGVQPPPPVVTVQVNWVDAVLSAASRSVTVTVEVPAVV